MNDKEKPVTAGGIDLSDVDIILYQRIHNMLGEHENMENSRLGHISVA